MTYAELFAGAGGMSLGLEAGGFRPFAHAEIEPHARAVLRRRWPSVRLDGDVTQINGADYAGITLLSGGSPCQDLSVAGKRAGLTGSRSTLFHEQHRIWMESGAPYLLWENVGGALSSSNGYDFATVLSTLVGRDLVADRAIAADKHGKIKWLRAGRAVGPAGVAAWRVLDLQHFGPPQRRVRVFVLVARTGGVDPAEVLALREGVCGHPSPRQQSREIAARGTGGGVEGGVRVGAFNWKMGAKAHSIGWAEEEAPSVTGEMTPAVLAFHPTQTPISGDVSPAIGRPTDGMGVLAFGRSSFGGWDGQEVTSPVCSRDAKDASSIIIEQTLANGEDVTATLTVAYADKQGLEDQHVNSGCPLFVISSGQANASINAGLSPTLDTAVMAKPRRLTPLECERLMSWPDQWTATGRKDDGTTYSLSDTARYRLCGNGVGSPCAEWIARRLYDAIAQQEEA